MARHPESDRRRSWLFWPTLLVILVAIVMIMVLWVPVEDWTVPGRTGAPATAPTTQATPPQTNAPSTGSPAQQ